MKSISDIIKETAKIASLIDEENIEEPEQRRPRSSVKVAAADEAYELVKVLRNPEVLMEGLKIASLDRILEGDMPTREQLLEFSEKTASDISIEKGDTHAETLRNLASGLRKLAEEQKVASHVQTFKAFRGLVAAEKLGSVL